MKKALLITPTFYAPLAPPLGIATLKSIGNASGWDVKCIDLNTEGHFWKLHDEYLSLIRNAHPDVIIGGYFRLVWVFINHCLAYLNSQSSSLCNEIIRQVLPVHGLKPVSGLCEKLTNIIEKYFMLLENFCASWQIEQFSLVGTSTICTSLPAALFLLREAKRQRTNVTTVMGGSIFFGTFGAGSENFQSLVSKNEFSFVDHFVIGPGELPFSYLLDGNLSDERVIYSCSVSNSPIAIEDIPMPDFSDFDMNIYPSIGIEGSRGCPFSCEFCIESNQWGPYANKSGGDLADEILTYSNRYQKSKFFLCDSVTNAYIDDLSSNLIKKRSDIYFDAFLRSDKSVLTKNVSNWAKAGLGCVRTGIESGSSRVLKLMNKKITSKISEDCLRLIADNGIRPLTFWVIGFPGETTDDFQETLEYIRRNKTWIYEIEAHPFVTFETDQPSSTTHRIKKCYPEEVTNITKLQLWETVAEPSPGERYKRLVEVELTAKECGIPTINTLADFAKAEKRWKDLHSNAINIFR